MERKTTFLFLIFIILIAISSCERDEICIDPITPKFSIAFYDVDDIESKKSINNLAIEILDKDGIGKSIDTLGRDSISVPLNIYELQTIIVITTNSKSVDLINRDTIRISYETEEVFVGRSCGYKSIFRNVIINNNFNDDNKWIKSLTEKQTEILDETIAHVKILH